MNGESLLDKLDRKMGRHAPRNLMTVIVVGTALVWLLDMIVYQKTEIAITRYLAFDRAEILSGQVWRLITFIFVPDTWNLFSLALTLYFYWLIGNTLENEWGSFRFDIFYLCGVLGAIASGFITGYTTGYYLNLSLFLAFAILYPDYQVLLFFFIPIKVKWLAILDLVGLILLFVFGTWAQRAALLFALGNIVLFFWRAFFRKIYNIHRRRKWKRDTKRKNGKNGENYPFDL